jgi:hypothetical protein
VDFYAGGVTREHDDVDIAVSLEDHARIAELLGNEGWVHAPEPDEDGGTGYERAGVRLELTFFECVPWPPEALGCDVGELDGVRASLISLVALKRGKSSPRGEPEEASKDLADAIVLAGL